MQTILLVTDFSPPARHALRYACLQFKDKEVKFELLHIAAIPLNYTADGIALAGAQNDFDRAEALMDAEIAFVTQDCGSNNVRGRVISGPFIDTLKTESDMVKPYLIILGTEGFRDLFSVDDNPLNALRSMKVPVLFIPSGAALKPIRNIVYVCNYALAGPRLPVADLISRVTYLGGQLQVLHIDKQEEGQDDKQLQGMNWLKPRLAPLAPQYIWVQEDDTIHGLSHYILHHEVDCVLAVPHKYGIWQNIFHRSRLQALVRLNKVPVLTFPERLD